MYRLLLSFLSLSVLSQSCTQQTPPLSAPLDAIYLAGAPEKLGADGRTWANAFSTFKAALERVKEIRAEEKAQNAPSKLITIAVKVGTYRPAEGAETLIDLSGFANLELLGGFAGNSESLSDQDLSRKTDTILSGEWLYSDQQPAGNVKHVIRADYAERTNAQLTIKGFTISGGKAELSEYIAEPNNQGGGLYAKAAFSGSEKKAILIEEVVFKDNTAISGGGLALNDSDVQLKNVTFQSNKAKNQGGAIASIKGSLLDIDGGQLRENIAETSGGGIYAEGVVTINGVTFESNKVTQWGGAIFCEGSSTLNIGGGTFSRNSATYGGGISTNCTTTIDGVAFESNEAKVFGGAIDNGETGTLNVKSGSFSKNSATYGGGISTDGTATLFGAAFEHNIATSLGGALYNSKLLILDKDDANLFQNNLPENEQVTLENATFQGIRNGRNATISLTQS